MKKDKVPEMGKALDVAMKNMKGFAKKASVIKDPEFISTGDFYLDLAIAHGVSPDESDFDITKYDMSNLGGLPRGYLTEFSGGEGSGKSYRSYRVIANAQKKGLKCLWIDAEHSFSKSLAEINGVDLEQLDVADLIDLDDPNHIFSAEEVFDRICDACPTYGVVVLDSVAALETKAELENELAEGGVGLGSLAGVLSKAVKKVGNHAAKHNTLVIIINQVREKIGGYGSPESTPGGRALKHGASVRIKINKLTAEEYRITQEDENGVEKIIGGHSNAFVLKNRFGKPVNVSIRIRNFYTKYFPDTEDLVFDAGRQTQVVKKYKATYRWDEIVGEGKKDFLVKLKEKGNIVQLIAEIKAVAKEKTIALQPEVLNYVESKKEVKNDDDEAKISRRRKTKDSGGVQGESVEA